MKLTLSAIVEATGGHLAGAPAGAGGVVVDGASIDSRTLEPGQLFCAVVADRDGHEFVAAAAEAGAVACLVERAVDVGIPQVVVADTGAALADLAGAVRPSLGDRVIAITGSVAKTSTKDLIAAALGDRLRTHASYRSFNNELGVPLTLLGAPDDVEATVVEMGARGLGHIDALCRFVQPTVGVVTRVGAAHTELFGSVDDVARGKGELIAALPADGRAVLNAGDPRVAAMADRSAAPVLTYRLDGDDADVTATDIRLDDELHPTFVAHTPAGDHEITLAVAGVANVENALAAVAVGLACELDLASVADGLARAELSPWRMAVGRTRSGALVINDAYNANPLSTEAALRSLATVDADRRVAVLGVMAELGDEHDDAHRSAAALAAELGIEVVAFGERAYGVPTVDTHEEALAVLGALGRRDAVLVKGSRVAALEALVVRL